MGTYGDYLIVLTPGLHPGHNSFYCALKGFIPSPGYSSLKGFTRSWILKFKVQGVEQHCSSNESFARPPQH